MLPVLFSIGPYEFYTYGLTLAIAFIVGILIVTREASREGLDEDAVFNLSLLAIISALIGARLGFVVQNLKHYLANPKEILMVGEGGLTLYGGLFLAILVSWLYARRKALPFWKIANLTAPVIALGSAIARVGCFLNGCCYGREALPPWGVSFDGGLPVYPVQLWESGLCLLLFFGLWKYRKKARDGQLFLMYLAGYSLIRFVIEFWRWGEPIFLSLTLAQWVSLGILAVAAVFLRKKINHDISQSA
ncbi:MAG: prolipoprotein diacylglyceryl transferase [Firmicutes bacterium]|jgi:phosphatidylglycerol:prolipoprotein diacylglycerol transferase|nr:prolipoprotein diacylglyceryl transferase [Bacillota bacterium]HQD39749.1 prolipoprotein diacylglyceryl transferase [Bacillota bacterium]